MYAVVKTGGKQEKVEVGDIVRIEKVPGEAGDKVTFDSVLMLNDGKKATVGAPLVKGAKVKGEILEQTRDDKIIVFKKKRRKKYRLTKGHKQHKTVVKITDIAA